MRYDSTFARVRPVRSTFITPVLLWQCARPGEAPDAASCLPADRASGALLSVEMHPVHRVTRAAFSSQMLAISFLEARQPDLACRLLSKPSACDQVRERNLA